MSHPTALFDELAEDEFPLEFAEAEEATLAVEEFPEREEFPVEEFPLEFVEETEIFAEAAEEDGSGGQRKQLPPAPQSGDPQISMG